MNEFDHILNWKLLEGSHEFPGPDGGTCINEAAIVAAGFPYRAVENVEDMPPCFSRVISLYALTLNDLMPKDQRQRLIPYVMRLAGTADTPKIEVRRAEYLGMQAVNVFAAIALDAAGLHDNAERCRKAMDLKQAKAAAALRTAACGVAWAAREAAAWAARDWVLSANFAARAAAEASAWDDSLRTMDGVLAIGRQGDAIPMHIAVKRLECAKADVPA
jgi:hypothetical protein